MTVSRAMCGLQGATARSHHRRGTHAAARSSRGVGSSQRDMPRLATAPTCYSRSTFGRRSTRHSTTASAAQCSDLCSGGRCSGSEGTRKEGSARVAVEFSGSEASRKGGARVRKLWKRRGCPGSESSRKARRPQLDRLARHVDHRDVLDVTACDKSVRQHDTSPRDCGRECDTVDQHDTSPREGTRCEDVGSMAARAVAGWARRGRVGSRTSPLAGLHVHAPLPTQPEPAQCHVSHAATHLAADGDAAATLRRDVDCGANAGPSIKRGRRQGEGRRRQGSIRNCRAHGDVCRRDADLLPRPVHARLDGDAVVAVVDEAVLELHLPYTAVRKVSHLPYKEGVAPAI